MRVNFTKQMPKVYFQIFSLIVILSLGACFSTPPIEADNICNVLDEKVSWYKAVKKAQQKWGVSKALQLAFINQESRFASDAKPPREELFGFVPWFRRSSAYGFGQVKDTTWRWYEQKTNNSGASRDDFADVTDFIGWYVNVSHRQLGINKGDVYNQYLAYHEGHQGFKNKSYRRKDWILGVAKSVEKTATKYAKQLNRCQKQLDSNYGWRFF